MLTFKARDKFQILKIVKILLKYLILLKLYKTNKMFRK